MRGEWYDGHRLNPHHNEKEQYIAQSVITSYSIHYTKLYEGDFSPNEVEKAKASGAAVISLGESRLRTETAGVVACHTIHLLNQ